jgi:hypothetical protein
MLIKEALSILTATNEKIQQLGVSIVSTELQGSPKQATLQTQLNQLVMRYTMLLQHIILNDDGDEILGTIGENDTDLNSILIALQDIANLNDLPGLPIPRVTYTTTGTGTGLPTGNASGDILVFNGTAWVLLPRGASGEVLVSTPSTIQWQSIVGNGIPSGGATGQLLKKNSNDDYDAVWANITLTDVGVSASVAEVDILNGAMITTAELNTLQGISTGSPLVTQLAGKLSTTLASANIWIGNGTAVAVDTSASGDILADSSTGLTIKSGVIINADINATAAIARTKIASGSSNRVLINDNTGVMAQASAITASRVLVSNADGIPVHSSVTTTTLAFVDPTSSVQTQFSNKLEFSSAIVPVEGDLIYYNGAAWVNLAIGTNGQLLSTDGVTVQWVTDPPTGLPAGGSASQVLRKIDGTDYNAEWHTLVAADLTDVVATFTEINILSGVTATSAEINLLVGLTGAVLQTQLSNKLGTSLAYNALFVGSAANIATQLAPGNDGEILTIVGTTPQWTAPAAPGDVSGPGAGNSTDNAVVRWNTTSGTSIQNSTVILDDNGLYTFPSAGGLLTGTSAGNTLLVRAYDVNGTAYVTFITLTANDTPTMDFNNTTTVGGDIIYRNLSGYPLAQPTVTEDLQSIRWNNGTLQWEYYTPGTGGGHVIQNSGTPLTARSNLNFNVNLVATDDVGNDASVITLNPDITLVDTITFNNGGSIRTGTTAADTLLFQAYDNNTGPAYVTFATLTAGNTPTFDLSDSVTKSGAYIYRVGGTDITLADGGTGASLADPGADRILFWDDSAGAVTWLTAGTGLTITTTTITIDDEAVQDAVGGILANTTTINLTYNDGTPNIVADVNTNSISNSLIRQSSGLSVIGRSANSTGDVADIIGTDGQVLRVSGTSLGFGSVLWSSLSGTSTAWLLASGGTLTGVNTITSNTANQLIFTGTWTATANNQYYANFGGSFTSRATASDVMSGYKFTPSITLGSTTQELHAVLIQPTFTSLDAASFAYFLKLKSDVANTSTSPRYFIYAEDSTTNKLFSIQANGITEITSPSTTTPVLIITSSVTSNTVDKFRVAGSDGRSRIAVTGNDKFSIGNGGGTVDGDTNTERLYIYNATWNGSDVISASSSGKGAVFQLGAYETRGFFFDGTTTGFGTEVTRQEFFTLRPSISLTSFTGYVASLAIRPTITQTTGGGPVYGIYYNPVSVTVAGAGVHYGLGIASGLNGFGTLTPTHQVHVKGTSSNQNLFLVEEDGGGNAFEITEAAGVIKIGYFAAAPVAQQSGLTTFTHTAPGTPDYAIQDLIQGVDATAGWGFATKDEGNTVLSIIKAMQDALKLYGLLT